MDEPVLVYDDDCGFCTWWAEFVADRSGVRLVGFSELDPESPLLTRLPADYEDCSHLVTDDAVYSCGASVEEALLRAGLGTRARSAAEALREYRTYRRLREWGYHRGADNRSLLGRIVSKRPPAREKVTAERGDAEAASADDGAGR